MEKPMLQGNKSIQKALVKVNADRNDKTVKSLVRAIQKQMKAGIQFLLPVEDPDPADDRTFRIRVIPDEKGDLSGAEHGRQAADRPDGAGGTCLGDPHGDRAAGVGEGLFLDPELQKCGAGGTVQ